MSLEELRKKRVELTTRPELFLGVKRLFHSVESIGSARIEGNHTTIADYVESQRGVPTSATEADLQEIENIEHTLRFIEETIVGGYRSRRTISSSCISASSVDSPRGVVRGEITPLEHSEVGKL